MKQFNIKINQFERLIADLNLRQGTETDKTRPVLVVQTNWLNKIYTEKSVLVKEGFKIILDV